MTNATTGAAQSHSSRSEVIPAISLLAELIRVVEVGCVPKDVGACDAGQRFCEAMKLGHCSTMRGEAESASQLSTDGVGGA